MEPRFLGERFSLGLVRALAFVPNRGGHNGDRRHEFAFARMTRNRKRQCTLRFKRAFDTTQGATVNAGCFAMELRLASAARDSVCPPGKLFAFVHPRRCAVDLTAKERNFLRNQRLDAKALGTTCRAACINKGSERSFGEGHGR